MSYHNLQSCSLLLATSLLLTACGGGGSNNNASPYAEKLNDTGITTCTDATGAGTEKSSLDCAAVGSTISDKGIDADGDDVPAGQDAVYGRDASDNSDSDGKAGFSFSKLDENGNVLDASATAWACVKDNVTGLVWEVKTDDDGLRDKDWTYSWYNKDDKTNGGDAGTMDTGAGAAGENCFNNEHCDSEKFVADVNTTGLCGFKDWRLPSHEELSNLTLLNGSNPTIDSDYFPNTNATLYWTATSSAKTPSNAKLIHFMYGSSEIKPKSEEYLIRLVRNGH